MAVVMPLGFFGQVRQEFCPCRAFGHMTDFLYQFSVLLRNGKEEVLDYHGVKTAGGGAYCKDSADIEENDNTIFFCNNVVEQATAFRCNIGFAEHLSDSDYVDDTAVPPEVVMLDQQLAFYNTVMLSMRSPSRKTYSPFLKVNIFACRQSSMAETSVSLTPEKSWVRFNISIYFFIFPPFWECIWFKGV